MTGKRDDYWDGATSRPRDRLPPFAATALAIPAALVLLVWLETLQIPVEVRTSREGLLPAVLQLAFAGSWGLFAELILAFGVFAACQLLPRTWRRLPVQLVVVAVGSAVLTKHIYDVLTQYEGFRDYLPFQVSFALFAPVLTLPFAVLGAGVPGSRWRTKMVAVSWLWAGSAGAGFAVLVLANKSLYPGLYPTLHLTWLLLSLVLLHAVLATTFHGLWRFHRGVGGLVALSALLTAGLSFGVSATAQPKQIALARPIFLTFTALGKSSIVGNYYTAEREDAFAATVPDDPQALERFARYSRMPKLPDSFDLAEHNVLLIMVEATRFDETSLFDPARATTPSLVDFVRRGAWNYSRAFAPSSGTLHSLASLMSMTYASHTSVESWGRPWRGQLHEEVDTVAELFSLADYATFRITHNFAHIFSRKVLGFEQGFGTQAFVQELNEEDALVADSQIAELVIKELERQASSDKRFFGWAFFASPHARYYAHYDDMPAKTHQQRYRQEIRFADEQIGKVIHALDRLGLFEDTVVIVAADHGEEFGEHGGTLHKATVYTEVTNVPLLIWIPGSPGRTIDEPTSLTYVFPWLLQHGAEPQRRAATRVIEEHHGPMMRATDGAVVIELIGHDRMHSSLVYSDHKMNFDFIAERYEAFDVHQDRLEQRNLLLQDVALYTEVIERVARYRETRSSRRRYQLFPEKSAVPQP